MIAAKIHPPTPGAEQAINVYRYLTKQARHDRAKFLFSARERAQRYSRHVREGAHQQGLCSGRESSRQEISSLVESIRAQYMTAIDLARKDVSEVAHQIVEHLIESYLQENPDQLRGWIYQALESLKHLRPLTLRYHPRYAEGLASFLKELEGSVLTQVDPSLGDTDFSLESSSGGISLAWRELLQHVGPVKTPEGA